MEQDDLSLLDAVRSIIDNTPKSLSEYELITILNHQGWSLSLSSTDAVVLFTSHFLVFNALYRLQQYYWESDQRFLEISALSIFLHDSKENGCEEASLSSYHIDLKLRDYYLDLDHLENATHSSVNDLLNQFWNRFVAGDDVLKALKLFSLDQSTHYGEIKKRYRILAMQHHPDRGGKLEDFKEINDAFGKLQRAYYK